MRMRCSPLRHLPLLRGDVAGKDRGASVPRSGNSAPRRPIPRKRSVVLRLADSLSHILPVFQARDKERRNINSNPESKSNPIQSKMPRFFHGVRRTPSGSGSPRRSTAPSRSAASAFAPGATADRSRRHHARKKHHCSFVAIMFFYGKYQVAKKRFTAMTRNEAYWGVNEA